MAQRKSKKNVAAHSALVAATSADLAAFAEVFDPEMSAGVEGAAGYAPFISTEDGVMKLKDNVIGKKLDAVILGVAIEHTLYPGRYQKGKPNPAVCFYVGPGPEDEAKPHASSPQPQSATCGTCIKNAFGSGQGNAKACRQSRRLLIMPLGPNDDPAKAEIYRLRVPPTSIKHLVSYGALLKSYKRPIQTVVTSIEFEGHETNRFEVRFSAARPVDRDTIEVLARRAVEGKDALFALPMVGPEKGGAPAATKGGRRVVRR